MFITYLTALIHPAAQSGLLDRLTESIPSVEPAELDTVNDSQDSANESFSSTTNEATELNETTVSSEKSSQTKTNFGLQTHSDPRPAGPGNKPTSAVHRESTSSRDSAMPAYPVGTTTSLPAGTSKLLRFSLQLVTWWFSFRIWHWYFTPDGL